jgi:hypothetical protein
MVAGPVVAAGAPGLSYVPFRGSAPRAGGRYAAAGRPGGGLEHFFAPQERPAAQLKKENAEAKALKDKIAAFRAARVPKAQADSPPAVVALEGPCVQCGQPGHAPSEEGQMYCRVCWRLWDSIKAKMQRRTQDQAEDSDGEVVDLCKHCRLPLGERAYGDKGRGAFLHGECLAELLHKDVREGHEASQQEASERKQKQRQDFDIGWRPRERVPRNFAPARALGLELQGKQGLCGVVIQSMPKFVRLLETARPAASVNLEYLSLALRVRREEAREPFFSLDPQVPFTDPEGSKQVKYFEPKWLAGTSLGEVMFQADYYLKELSMGEQPQPVLGMTSCFDHAEKEGDKKGWIARTWYVVKKADVYVSDDDFLVPYVEMGVEARDLVDSPVGLVDAPITRSDHPMVLYAKDFTHHFDLIAERKSAVHHLREAAKAAILAKYLVDSKVGVPESWLDVVDTAAIQKAAAACLMEIPQLWNDRCHSHIGLKDGQITNASKNTECVHSVYGGVEMGLDRAALGGMSMGEARLAALATPPEVSFFPFTRQALGPASFTSMVMGGAEEPRGVDLNLDAFDLTAPKRLEDGVMQQQWSLCSCADMLQGKGSGSVLAKVFDPVLSDRRDEGDLFVGPDPSAAHMGKLAALVREEEQVRQRRRERFLSEDFAIGTACNLFPSSWASSIEITRQRRPCQLVPCPCDSVDLKSVSLQDPIFDKSTEDGCKYRIYKRGNLEVRTLKAYQGAETVEAVFSSSGSSEVAPPAAAGKAAPELKKVTQYVAAATTAAAEDEGKVKARYFVTLEAECGTTVVTEMLADGSSTWEEGPADIDERLACAKVVASSECCRGGPGASKKSLESAARARAPLAAAKIAGAATRSERKRYARDLFSWASGADR